MNSRFFYLKKFFKLIIFFNFLNYTYISLKDNFDIKNADNNIEKKFNLKIIFLFKIFFLFFIKNLFFYFFYFFIFKFIKFNYFSNFLNIKNKKYIFLKLYFFKIFFFLI